LSTLLEISVIDDDASVRAATEVVEMHEGPASALRGKKDSSMRVAVNLVKDGSDDFHFVISQSGSQDATQGGRDLRFGHGDATLMRLCVPGMVRSHEGIVAVVMVIPFAELKARVADVDSAVVQRVPRRSEPLRLLHGYVRSLQRSLPGASTKAHETFRRHIIDLVALAVTPGAAVGESELSAVAAARLDAALGHIAARFQEPDLAVTSIARSQGISPRYLQRLIETTGTTFTARLTELRLQRAFALLIEARDGTRRISDIALQAGFSDISHFNRLFRSRFGDTPRGILAQRVSEG